MKDLFKPQDFIDDEGWPTYTYDQMARLANKKLNQLIETWPLVRSITPCNFWAKESVTKFGDLEITHTARLAFIEETSKEPCKHEPSTLIIHTKNNIVPLREISKFINTKCQHCGVDLVAKWEAK